jgi:hypothetical protein
VSSREIRFPFRFVSSRAGRLPSSLCQPGPIYQIYPLPHTGRPWSEIHCTATPRLGCHRAFTALPHHSPPLIPFKPSLNALNVYSPRRYSGHPSRCPPAAPIKGRGAPPGHHHTHLALNRVLPSPQLLLSERHRLPVLHLRRPASTAPPELW